MDERHAGNQNREIERKERKRKEKAVRKSDSKRHAARTIEVDRVGGQCSSAALPIRRMVAARIKSIAYTHVVTRVALCAIRSDATRYDRAAVDEEPGQLRYCMSPNGRGDTQCFTQNTKPNRIHSTPTTR